MSDFFLILCTGAETGAQRVGTHVLKEVFSLGYVHRSGCDKKTRLTSERVQRESCGWTEGLLQSLLGA